MTASIGVCERDARDQCRTWLWLDVAEDGRVCRVGACCRSDEAECETETDGHDSSSWSVSVSALTWLDDSCSLMVLSSIEDDAISVAIEDEAIEDDAISVASSSSSAAPRAAKTTSTGDIRCWSTRLGPRKSCGEVRSGLCWPWDSYLRLRCSSSLGRVEDDGIVTPRQKSAPGQDSLYMVHGTNGDSACSCQFAPRRPGSDANSRRVWPRVSIDMACCAA